MTSMRAYRKGMPIKKALTIIGNELGSQFDAQLGHHFLALDRSTDIAHIVGHSEPGIPLLPCPSCTAPVVVRSAQRDGEHIYCRACGGESRLHKDQASIALEMTGQVGNASVLAPDSDADLIGSMVEDMAPIVL